MNSLLIIISVYFIPILIIGIVDYIRCPKGTTLGNFICGSWYLNGVDGKYEGGSDGYLNIGFMVWIPFINVLYTIIILSSVLVIFLKMNKLFNIKIK